MCEWCQVRLATDLHHAIFHRRKGKKEFDVEENFCLLCHECHMADGRVNGFEFKQWFWERQCLRYGTERMQKWLDSLPLKIKRF